MSTYIDIDSSKRDLSRYPNPASYTFHAVQIGHWPLHPRRVSGNVFDPEEHVKGMYESVKAKNILIPAVDYTYIDEHGITRTGNTMSLQKIYLDIHTVNFNHTNSINSAHPIDPTGVVRNDRTGSSKFILYRNDIQLDENDQPRYLKFETDMDQVLRFERRKEIVVRLSQEDGHTIIIPDKSTGTTTLNNTGELTSIAATVTVADATVFSMNTIVKIDNEYIEITNIVANDLTIIRARLGSSASSHADFSTITAILDRSSQINIILELTPYARDAAYHKKMHF